ncbi:Ion transport domain, partial [Trinorchestia longiramus]
RFSRAVRPVLCVCWPELRSVRVALRTLRRALPAVAHVALLYCAVLVTAALMAYKMLGHKGLVLVSGRPYFSSYWDSLFDMYVLVTTANHPDIMMPAFNEHVVYVTFFVAFLVLCYFIYMNVVLAVIYNSYKQQLKAEVLESFLSRQQQLQQAFDLLCHKGGSGRSGVCSGRFQQLLLALPQRRSPALTAVLFAVLDSDNSGSIDRVEFRRLADLLSVEVSEIHTQWRCLQMVSSAVPRCSRALTALVNSRWFQYFFDGLTVANAVVISVSEEDSWWDAPLEWCFLSCFLLEIALKLLTLGIRRFFRRAWNTFDFIVIGLAFAIGVAEAVLDEERESRLSLDVLLVLRVLRLVKIVGSIKSFQMIVHTLAKIVPSLTTYGAVILIFYYKFAIVGMEIFAGLIKTSSNTTTAQDLGSNNTQDFPLYCGNPALEDTDYWRQRYCNNNFNDVLHAFIVLFELTVVNQWHVLAYGFSAVTHSAARLLFLVFHLLCVTLLLNVFTAFVLEVFLLEYSASEGIMETQLESKIVALGLSETRRRRKFSTISHDELVMQDSDEEEDDYYLSKKNESNSKKTSLPNTSAEDSSTQYRESD